MLTSFFNIMERLFWAAKHRAYRKKYTLSANCTFDGTGSYLCGNGDIFIGEHVVIGTNFCANVVQGTKLTIKNGTLISGNVSITTSRPIVDQDFAIRERTICGLRERAASITIGNYVWVGDNVTIYPGVRIGDNSVIVANSLVTQSIPENSIASGIPAKAVRAKWERE